MSKDNKQKKNSSTAEASSGANVSVRPVRFYCQRCGKELFEDMNYNDYKKDTLEYYLHATKKCSDCLLEDIQKTH